MNDTQPNCNAIFKLTHPVGLMYTTNKKDCHRKCAISAALRVIERYSRTEII